jgi:hypothetical protein
LSAHSKRLNGPCIGTRSTEIKTFLITEKILKYLSKYCEGFCPAIGKKGVIFVKYEMPLYIIFFVKVVENRCKQGYFRGSSVEKCLGNHGLGT